MANSLFHRMFLVKVSEVLDTRTEELASGQCKDYPSYREEVGYLRGLKDAVVIAGDVEREPDGSSNSA